MENASATLEPVSMRPTPNTERRALGIRAAERIRLCAGLLLLTLSLCGVVHGTRASLAQAMYHQAKYGSANNDTERIINRCENAHGLYPYNYYFCIWTAEKAYYAGLNSDGTNARRHTAAVRAWCDRGLALNFHKSQLRLLKTRLLENESLAAAIKYWEEYVDWHFWEPYNHAVLAEMYAGAGDFDKAIRSLRWVKGSEHYDKASARLQEAWKRETNSLREMRPAHD